MGKRERRTYLEAIRARYRRASKAGKTAILNEFCAVCGYHRKYALRLLGKRNRSNKTSHKPGPTSRYNTPELVAALRTVWMASDPLCSKRLKAALPLWLPHYGTSVHPLQEAYPDSGWSMGCDPARLHRSRHGGALRGQLGGRFRMEFNHDRSLHRLAGRQGNQE